MDSVFFLGELGWRLRPLLPSGTHVLEQKEVRAVNNGELRGFGKIAVAAITSAVAAVIFIRTGCEIPMGNPLENLVEDHVTWAIADWVANDPESSTDERLNASKLLARRDFSWRRSMTSEMRAALDREVLRLILIEDLEARITEISHNKQVITMMESLARDAETKYPRLKTSLEEGVQGVKSAPIMRQRERILDDYLRTRTGSKSGGALDEIIKEHESLLPSLLERLKDTSKGEILAYQAGQALDVVLEDRYAADKSWRKSVATVLNGSPQSVQCFQKIYGNYSVQDLARILSWSKIYSPQALSIQPQEGSKGLEPPVSTRSKRAGPK